MRSFSFIIMDLAKQELVNNFYSSVKTSDIEAKVAQIPENIDREQYLSMKGCKKCLKAFSKHTSKKYYCHFCYQAFCSECCVLTTHHPETQKSERVCNHCYLFYTKINVLEVSENFVQVKLVEEIKARENLENKLAEELIKNIDFRKLISDEKENFKLEKEKIEGEIKEENEKIRSKVLSTEQMRTKIGTKGNSSGQVVANTSGGRSCMECEIF